MITVEFLSCEIQETKFFPTIGQSVSLKAYGDPHLAAVLIKKFLRDLPEPIFPETTYPIIKRCPTPVDDQDDSATINYIRQTLLPELAPCTLIILSHILGMSFLLFCETVIDVTYSQGFCTMFRKGLPRIEWMHIIWPSYSAPISYLRAIH